MTDIPIIFSGVMVKAWLAGTKSMTRRLLYSERKTKGGIIPASATALEGHPQPRVDLTKHIDTYYTLSGWQKVRPGDLLWVRENIRCGGEGVWRYAADDVTVETADSARGAAMVAWAHHEERESVPSIHMPRILSRLTLIVSAVKIEPLHRIRNAEAWAEGVTYFVEATDKIPWGDISEQDRREITANTYGTPVMAFCHLWQTLHGEAAWDENPEVVAITATAIKANIDSLEKVAA